MARGKQNGEHRAQVFIGASWSSWEYVLREQLGDEGRLPGLGPVHHDLAAALVESREHAEVALARQRLQIVGGLVHPAGGAVEGLPRLHRAAEPQPELRGQGQDAAEPAVLAPLRSARAGWGAAGRVQGRGGAPTRAKSRSEAGSRWNRASKTSSGFPHSSKSRRRSAGERPERSAWTQRAPAAARRRQPSSQSAGSSVSAGHQRPDRGGAGRQRGRGYPRSRSSSADSRSTTNATPWTGRNAWTPRRGRAGPGRECRPPAGPARGRRGPRRAWAPRAAGRGRRRAAPRPGGDRHEAEAAPWAPRRSTRRAAPAARWTHGRLRGLPGARHVADPEAARAPGAGRRDGARRDASAASADSRASPRAASMRCTYLASTSTSRFTRVARAASRARVVTSSVWGISATSKRSGMQGGDGEADAVDRHRALLHQERRELGRDREARAPGDRSRSRRSTTRAVPSTCPWTMWPPRGSPMRSAGSRLTSSPRRRPPRLVRDRVSGDELDRRRGPRRAR